MKKFFSILIALIILLIILMFIAWANKTWIAESFLSKALGVPVQIKSTEYTPGHLYIRNLHIGNPPGSHTKTAFHSKNLDIDATLEEVFGDPLIIEKIVISDIFIGIEFYNKSGTRNNWATILSKEKKPKKKKKERNYHIRKLILHDLTVVLTQADGTVKKFPTLERMEFDNITDETGFPVEEIEKAIFNKIMKEVFMEYGLKLLRETLDPSKWIPGGIPFFGPSSSNDQKEQPQEQEYLDAHSNHQKAS